MRDRGSIWSLAVPACSCVAAATAACATFPDPPPKVRYRCNGFAQLVVYNPTDRPVDIIAGSDRIYIGTASPGRNQETRACHDRGVAPLRVRRRADVARG